MAASAPRRDANPARTLTVAHRLRLALGLELVQVRQDRVELLARRGLVLLVVAEGDLSVHEFTVWSGTHHC